MYICSKKGFSLVEVIVAIGILSVVMMASFTTMMAAVKLSSYSRDVTIMTQLAQSGISKGTQQIRNSICTGDATVNYTNSLISGGYTYKVTAKAIKASVQDSTGSYVGSKEFYDLPDTATDFDFYKVVSTATTSDQADNVISTYEVYQYVKK